ncbi:YxeA family protein [Paenibacillus monticola]|uniref:YxeA family protein n=1 Tax=Paenibacillus monticola TaxID=2666075 RepID=A0A7X2L2J2_9BACL|nr:YxeA family protein [Paenibacillus monticola]MRN54937.1 YxeA family protein [Paenibacillus monticola]
MKKKVAFILIAVVIFAGFYVTFKRDFDQFNPLYKEKYVYAVINKPAEQEGKDEWIRYRYNLSGYTAQGEKIKITFSSSNEQEQDAYVRVLAKGDYTAKWAQIPMEVIPDKAFNKLSSH